jgi:integrase/recombinase XerD
MLGSVMDDGQVDGVRQRGLVVRRVVVPPAGAASWTVIGGDRRPVVPVEAFLRWLTDIERSPNTVRAYAGDLRQFWEFL